MTIFNRFMHFLFQTLVLPPARCPTTTQLVVGLITPVSTLLIIIALSSNIPFYDQWQFVPLLDQLFKGTIKLESLWIQHNEHRILFPRLLMLLLATISGWNIYVEIAAIWIMAVMIFLLLCFAANNQFSLVSSNGKRYYPYKIYVAFSILVFSMVQAENWLWGWQITIFMSVLSTVCGYYILIFKPFKSNLSFFITIVCGIISTFSFANGLLYWPIGLVLILLGVKERKWSVVQCLLLTTVAIIAYVCYFLDYKNVSHHPPLLYGFQHPIKLLCYYVIFLGAPICQAERLIAISFIVGGVGLIITSYMIFLMYKQNQLLQWPFMFWHSLLLYVLLTAVITALGRSGFGMGQALSGRYVTITNLFWIWIVVIYYSVHRRNIFNQLLSIFLVFAMVMIILSGFRNVNASRFYQQKLASQELQLRSGKLDLLTLKNIYKEDPTLILIDNETLKRYRLSFYAH